MSFRKYVSVVCATLALVLTLTVSLGSSAKMIDWWHALTQVERNQRIVDRAQVDSGKPMLGLTPKEWVSRVVLEASGSSVTLPENRANNYEWRNHPYVDRFNHGNPPHGIQPGHIIQMTWRNRGSNILWPHTAIILSQTNTGMTWIDNNWQGDRRIRVHFVSFRDFRRYVGNRYMVYKIR